MSSPHPDTAPSLEVELAGERHLLMLTPADRASVLSDILRRAGLPLNTRCGGRGLCDGCMVELVRGKLTHAARKAIGAETDGASKLVRSCECRVDGVATKVRIPARSSMRHEPQIVADYQIRVPFSHDPLYQQVPVGPTRTLEQLQTAIARACYGLPVRIASSLTQSCLTGIELYAAVQNRGDHRLVTGVTTQPAGSNLGAAVDIGTTTVALMLVDLANGSVIGRASKFNEQVHLGEDVVTRINFSAGKPANVAQLQQAVAVGSILPLLESALQQAGQPIEAVRCMALAGNTTMMHLLAGVDPSPLGVAPFKPVFLSHRVIEAGEIFSHSSLDAKVPCHLLPGAAAYVGADLTAGVVATGLYYDAGPSVLIDVGTNGEIILKHGDELIGCATAAGPAFEGALLSSGMRAVNGAISHVRFGGDPPFVHYEVIGDANTLPIGLCGSAYVDFLAAGHAAGILTDTGRFNTDIAPELRERITPWNQTDTAFRVAHGPGKQPITICGHDVAALLQAKAAIAAGILTLLDQYKLKASDIRTVYLAGGFGTKMDRAAAIGCGLLPGFTVDQVVAVGNTSLAGAYLFLMDGGLVAETTAAAERIRIVELNLDPNFESQYIDQLFLGIS